ncbi:MAG: hypothetical protein ACR2OR_05005 [Hyphomicrobiales bacterium]
MQRREKTFFENGWCRFETDPAVERWIEAALPVARKAAHAPEYAEWLRCGGTWFAGVNALDNDATGAVPGGPPLSGEGVEFIQNVLGLDDFEWDRGQISICYPGYPKPMESEPETAFKYRLKRDAAHVDGLHPVGPERRRYLREMHGFLLGLPLVEADAGAAPFVVWEGSHEIMRKMFAEFFGGLEPAEWADVDATEAYHAARRRATDTCRRVEITAAPGEAYLVHRFALHGVAPWANGAQAGADGRMIAYFRPAQDDARRWLGDR